MNGEDKINENVRQNLFRKTSRKCYMKSLFKCKKLQVFLVGSLIGYVDLEQGSQTFFGGGRITAILAAAGQVQIENKYTSIHHFH